jgi:Spy/CpxP family protein refolding chaperone
MGFFIKRKLRHALFGITHHCRHHGCHSGDGAAPEASDLRRAWIVQRVADKLSLNAEQKPLFAALVEQIAAQRRAMVGNTPDFRAELRSWFAGSHFDASRAQALINDKVSALQSQSPHVVAALAGFYDSLNAAQQQRVRELMDGRRRGWF